MLPVPVVLAPVAGVVAVVGFAPRVGRRCSGTVAPALLVPVVFAPVVGVVGGGVCAQATVIAALSARRGGLHVVVTGRNAKPEVIAAADLVTEMTLVKHPFRAGVKAQPGIEF